MRRQRKTMRGLIQNTCGFHLCFHWVSKVMHVLSFLWFVWLSYSKMWKFLELWTSCHSVRNSTAAKSFDIAAAEAGAAVCRIRGKVYLMQCRNEQLIKTNCNLRFSRNGNRIDLWDLVLWSPTAFLSRKDFKEGAPTLDSAVTDMSACSFNYWLTKFVQEVSNCLGERYPCRTLYSIICGPRRHLALHWTYLWACPIHGKNCKVNVVVKSFK